MILEGFSACASDSPLSLTYPDFRPSPNAAIFITLIVKAPIIQILAMIMGLFIIALEFPLPQLKKLAIHRSIVLRIVLLLFQTFLTILFYQVSISPSPILAALTSSLGHECCHIFIYSSNGLYPCTGPRGGYGGRES